MTREKLKEFFPALEHFLHGGNLWSYNTEDKKWYLQSEFYTRSKGDYIDNIIEDNFFEARKAYALGEEIEQQVYGTPIWHKIKNPLWNSSDNYRPAPIYEWQYIIKPHKNSNYYDTTSYHTEKEMQKKYEACKYFFIEKYERSKRIRKK